MALKHSFKNNIGKNAAISRDMHKTLAKPIPVPGNKFPLFYLPKIVFFFLGRNATITSYHAPYTFADAEDRLSHFLDDNIIIGTTLDFAQRVREKIASLSSFILYLLSFFGGGAKGN